MTFHQKSRSYFIKLYELPWPPPNQVKEHFARGEWIPFFFNAHPKKIDEFSVQRVTVILSWSTLRLKKGRWSALKEITFWILLVMSMWFMIELWIRTSQNKTGKTQGNQAKCFSFFVLFFPCRSLLKSSISDLLMSSQSTVRSRRIDHHFETHVKSGQLLLRVGMNVSKKNNIWKINGATPVWLENFKITFSRLAGDFWSWTIPRSTVSPTYTLYIPWTWNYNKYKIYNNQLST